MTEERPRMVGAATVFIVNGIAKSIEHDRDALGFTVTFQYGKPTFYACLCRDESLCTCLRHMRPSGYLATAASASS